MARARRQIMCRHCYTYGHTKRSCPQVKQIVKDNPHSYLADTLKRKCSYCRNEGHTKVKCPEFAEKKRVHNIGIMENREKVCQALTELGVAPGALMRAEVYVSRHDTDKVDEQGWRHLPVIVTKVFWEQVHRSYGDYIETMCPKYGSTQNTYLPKHRALGDGYGSGNTVISPAPHDAAKRYNETMMENTREKAMRVHGYK